MSFVFLTVETVEAIHDAVLNPGELQGRAMGKSLESALARVDNRILYGLVGDVFDLAALYAMAIARGHCFNDANKRTAHQAMDVCLALNGVEMVWNHEDIGQQIIALAQGLIDDGHLADWLRDRA
ncbi:MAG TPA: type II toxin-antitoxin system death-on-curing family toxin [Paracoccus solventivorans]|uniref:Type II toxin-antitoxin system death-on-curing family toxin n=1 Tax=Paracoccus solventivorans TaxID=53463 RepID=A0A832PRH6_9RHOB|nr:type II toxin-antitoxin system death-on-curing family toxin [Paracoccus solventivorans]HHW35411.1 type II toxin-antitoxin system death-on-curing family toxin [Paracoccus solventivorans]HMM07930.1 type II toxin-antitoxin system death-on-curing family toxin [Paracoccus solventivorans]